MYRIHPAQDSYNGEILWIWYWTNGLSCRNDGLLYSQGSAPWIVTYLPRKLLGYSSTLIGIGILLTSEGKAGKAWKPFRCWEALDRKVFSACFFFSFRYYFRRDELKRIPEYKNVTSTEQSVRNGVQKCVLSVLALCRVALGGCWWATNDPKWHGEQGQHCSVTAWMAPNCDIANRMRFMHLV